MICVCCHHLMLSLPSVVNKLGTVLIDVLSYDCRTKEPSVTAVDKKDSSTSYCHKLQHIRTLLREPEVARSRICAELGL